MTKKQIKQKMDTFCREVGKAHHIDMDAFKLIPFDIGFTDNSSGRSWNPIEDITYIAPCKGNSVHLDNVYVNFSEDDVIYWEETNEVTADGGADYIPVPNF